ncbi:MAG: DUF2238 domain-containing protein [Acidobacteria bacterium]|nr:DUF2238 domain-containing protein [Acidobacteriota bacterium]MBI3421500.1 DUF2238 domain-containing protein [Acidobacteriota bacterium]
MEQLVKRFEPLIALFFIVAGSFFLFRMAYLPGYISLPVGAALLLAFRAYIQTRYGLAIPYFLLLLCWISVGLDWLGNIFGWYRNGLAGMAYDELTHTAVPLLVVPCIVWLLDEGLTRFNYRLPLALTTVFAVALLFTVSGFYEVLELWDDKYMHPTPGWRIHGAYDTPNDLQSDFIGAVIGGVLAYFWLRRSKAGE